MSCLLSSVIYANELETNNQPNIELDLELPTPIKIKGSNGYFYLGFTFEQYKNVLNIYAMYDCLGDKHLQHKSELRLSNIRLDISLDRLKFKDSVIYVLKEDREFVHETWKLDRESANKEAKRQKIQIVLFTTGGVAVGIILGLIGSLFM